MVVAPHAEYVTGDLDSPVVGAVTHIASTAAIVDGLAAEYAQALADLRRLAGQVI